ncbi:hypothetical protein [Rhizobium leguminosarum]|uniref:hypothetical protein n=1 Tax=Rhizobium leguminosarum TaxID=384 RepID=UPI003F9746A3
MYDHYHPYRFAKIAMSICERITGIENDAATASADFDGSRDAAFAQVYREMLTPENLEMSTEELVGRLQFQGRLDALRANWLSDGMDILDISDAIPRVFDGGPIERVRTDGSCYIHFGRHPALELESEPDIWIDGLYIGSVQSEGTSSRMSFAFVCNDDASVAPRKAKAGSLFRSQTRAALGEKASLVRFGRSGKSLYGDPQVIRDRAMMRAAYLADAITGLSPSIELPKPH